MPLYPFETQLVVNADATSVILTDAQVTIYDPSDTGMTNPLALVDNAGLPLANPVQVTKQGFLPAFQASISQVMWSGGGYFGYLNSYQGLLNEVVAARSSVLAAASDATVAKNAAQAAEAAAEAAATAPTDAAIDQRLAAAGTVSAWKPNTAYLLNQYVISPDGGIVRANLAHTSGATYVASNWTGGASALSSYLPINVKDPQYGAVGDGVADDTAAIQAALDAVPAGGRAVYLPAGRYKVTSTLRLTVDGTTLYGDGTGMRVGATQDSRASRIEAAGSITGSVLLVQRAANDRPLHGVNIRDISIDGGLVGTNVDGVIFRSNMGHMDRVHIWRATGAGLRVLGYTSPSWETYDSTFTNLIIGNCTAAGFVLDSKSADAHLSHCIFLSNQDNFIVKGASAQVTGCHFYSAGRHDIWFDGGGSRCKFVNCKIEGAANHMVMIDSTNGGYSDLQFTGCGFSSMNSPAADNTYDYVFMTGPTGNGIARTTFVGNNFNVKGGTTIKPRSAINMDTSASQNTAILANVFGPPSHWGTSAVINNSFASLTQTIRANTGVPDSVPLKSTSATAYTPTIEDADRVVETTATTAVTVTIPTVATAGWHKGTSLAFTQYGTGQITLVGASGVTLRTARTLTTRARYSTVRLYMRGTNEWVVEGDAT